MEDAKVLHKVAVILDGSVASVKQEEDNVLVFNVSPHKWWTSVRLSSLPFWMCVYECDCVYQCVHVYVWVCVSVWYVWVCGVCVSVCECVVCVSLCMIVCVSVCGVCGVCGVCVSSVSSKDMMTSGC